jgi:hypothetical protein
LLVLSINIKNDACNVYNISNMKCKDVSQNNMLQRYSGSQETEFGYHYSTAPSKCGYLSVETTHIFLCVHKQNSEIIKPNTVAGKTGYKWKHTDT